ncbi:MAG: sigma-70 family RNA polymerase sigma factor [Clostridia bacterium]|nr:sigma-70 family RNA polymerase sigma factor [Clostridia bacterium]MBN2881991.1 sigma-70 family RNA polymerase sigma factor [Clostridia bacterium]
MTENIPVNENSLFEEYKQTGNIEIRNIIVEKYYYMAKVLANKFLNRGVEYDDLLQVASLALVKAAERFEPSMENKFSTFATPTIIGEIKKYFRDKASTIRMPRKYYELYPSVKGAYETLSQKLDKPPTPEEIADMTGDTPEDVIQVLEMVRSGNITSLDEEFDEEGYSRMEAIGDEDPAFDRLETKDLYDRALEALDENEKRVVEMRYRMGMSQKNIADEFGVSQMYISRLEKKIYHKMRKRLESN